MNLKYKNKYLPYIQGVIGFAIFLTKQNIGVYYFAASFIMHLIFAIKDKKIKEEAICYLKEIAVFLALLLCFIIAFSIKGNLYNFIDFCFLGIGEFAFKNISIDINGAVIALVALGSVILSIYTIFSKKTNDEIRNNNLKLFPYAFMSLLIMYPMLNIYHANIGSLLFTILLFINIDTIILKEQYNKKEFKIIMNIAISILIIIEVIYSGICYISYFKSEKENEGPYYGIIIEPEKSANIKNICEYIKKNQENAIDVKIVSYRANMYMCVLNQNNGVIDLPFYGNLGSEGERGLIKKIKKQQNTIFLIDEADKMFGQEAVNAIKYIKDNYNYEGKIEDFLIYSTQSI